MWTWLYILLLISMFNRSKTRNGKNRKNSQQLNIEHIIFVKDKFTDLGKCMANKALKPGKTHLPFESVR